MNVKGRYVSQEEHAREWVKGAMMKMIHDNYNNVKQCFYYFIYSNQLCHKYKNKGVQLVPIGIPTDRWKTWSPKTA